MSYILSLSPSLDLLYLYKIDITRPKSWDNSYALDFTPWRSQAQRFTEEEAHKLARILSCSGWVVQPIHLG